MSTLCKELVFLILQFLEEEGWKEAARVLERNSGYFFNMEHFEELVLKGDWVGAEAYLSGFTKFDDNKHSTKIYFEMRKHNFLEALDKIVNILVGFRSNDRAKALDILVKDLKVFAPENQELCKEMTQLLILDNLREHGSLSMYGDTETARTILVRELQKLIRANPIFQGKVDFPCVRGHRLRRIVNQSLNWQHLQCKIPQPEPNIRTLFADHVCSPPDEHVPSAVNAVISQSTSASLTSTVTDSAISGTTSCPGTDLDILDLCLLIELFCFIALEKYGLLISSSWYFPVTNIDGSKATDFASKKVLSSTADKETQNVPPCGRASLISPLGFCKNRVDNTVLGCGLTSITDLPITVARTLTEDSSPTSMDFHPFQHTHLLVGTNMGDIGLWNVASGEKLVTSNFKVWDISACTMAFKTALVKDPSVAVNRVTWRQDGSFFGVAYSKHIVHIYAYHGGSEIRQQLEIDAHIGAVNDLAFAIPNELALIITCGDDKTIQFFFSTSVDGNIKAWLYSDSAPRVDYDAPGLASTSIAYSTDGRRLFSCGTSKSGESFLVEWDESEGAIKRSYHGLRKSSSGVVKFDIMKNQFVAAGNEHMIKFWNLNNNDLLTAIDAEGDLPENPHIRFNKDNTLLAVFAKGNKIKILASNNGLQLLGICDDFYRIVEQQGSSINMVAVRNTSLEKANRPPRFRGPVLRCNVKVEKISKLIYGSAGNAILALASNGTHLLWKWPVSDFNLSGQVTTEVLPELWKPKNPSATMKNDLTANPEALPCFALSKNDCYLLSASGGKITLYNMLTFKTLAFVAPPKPAATCLAFHPKDNNIVAIGRDDCTILIYNVRLAQITIWNAESWEKEGSRILNIPDGVKSDTYVQFHPNDTQILAVHKAYMGIFVAHDLECVAEWTPRGAVGVSQATFSCDGRQIYAGLMDGSVGIYASPSLEFRCWIPTKVITPSIFRAGSYPATIAAHPRKPHQFAVGYTCGEVAVFEPEGPDTELWMNEDNDEASTATTTTN
ncbi:Topless-related protein 4 [Linum grandiflorum]